VDNWIRDKKGEKKKGGKEKDKAIMDISLFLSTKEVVLSNILPKQF